MNILFVLHRYPAYGGIENVTTYLANYLSDNGHKIYTYSNIQVDEEKLLTALSKDVTVIKALSTDVLAEENYQQLCDVVEKHDIQLIILQDSYCTGSETHVLRVCREKGIKLFVVEHNTPNTGLVSFKNVSPRSLYHRIKRVLFYPLYICRIKRAKEVRTGAIYDTCDKYILLSKEFIPIWEDIAHVYDHPKLTYINNPITIKSPDHFIKSKEKICLFAARLSSQKGCDKLIRIWSKVEKVWKDWTLVIVGDGEERPMMEKMVRRYGLTNVRFDGFQSNMTPYYEKASILCMTSIFEGWLLSLTEAMSYSCLPMTFNSYASAKEIIDDGENGYLIKPFEEETYASKLLELMDNPSKLTSMREKAYQKSLKFAIETIGRQWLKLINE